MFAVEDVHRAGGLLVGRFVAIHVVTIAIDSFLPFSLGQLDGAAARPRYRPVWVALGIVAAELLLALAITNHYRDGCRAASGGAAHFANFVVWTAATLHGMGSGTDRSAPWMIALFAVCAAAVAAAITLAGGVSARLGACCERAPSLVRAAAGGGRGGGVASGPLHTHARPWNAAPSRNALTGKILSSRADPGARLDGGPGDGRPERARPRRPPGRAAAARGDQLPAGAPAERRGLPGRGADGAQLRIRRRCTLADGTRRHVHAAWRLVDHANLRGRLSAGPVGAASLTTQ